MSKLQMLFRGSISEPKPALIICNAIDTRRFKENKIISEISKLNEVMDKHLRRCYHKPKLEVADRTKIRYIQAMIDYKTIVRKIIVSGKAKHEEPNLSENLEGLALTKKRMLLYAKLHAKGSEADESCYDILFVHGLTLRNVGTDKQISRIVEKTLPYLAYKEAGKEAAYHEFKAGLHHATSIGFPAKIPGWLPEELVDHLLYLTSDADDAIQKYHDPQYEGEKTLIVDKDYDAEQLETYKGKYLISSKDMDGLIEAYPILDLLKLKLEYFNTLCKSFEYTITNYTFNKDALPLPPKPNYYIPEVKIKGE